MIEGLESAAEATSEAVGNLGIGKTSVVLSEGFCPSCNGRASATPVVEFIDDETRIAEATVHCSACLIRWRCGTNPENDLPWIEHARVHDNLTLTVTINPPPEIPCKDDRWWEEEEEDA